MRVFLNEDWIYCLWSRYDQEIEEEALQNFIRQYKDTTITDFCFNVNGTVSTSMP